MNKRKPLAAWIISTAFVAATLQGSRLPQQAVTADQQVAQAAANPGHRMGSGSDQDERPPLPDRVFS